MKPTITYIWRMLLFAVVSVVVTWRLTGMLTSDRKSSSNVSITNAKDHSKEINAIIHTQRPQAAMFTPYHLTPGGGERYLLSSVVVLQELGYHVTLMVYNATNVRTLDGVKATANALRIDLDYDNLIVFPVVYVEEQLEYLSGEKVTGNFEVFYLLGNSKLPFISPLGSKFNIYMCQFPFDMDRKDPVKSLKVTSFYDSIIVNSRYTHRWHATYSLPTYRRLVEENKSIPTVSIVFPPVQPFQAVWKEQSTNTLIPFYLRDHTEHFNIVMLGRFFEGRQSKGHFAALRILKSIVDTVSIELKSKIRLYMIGRIQPEEIHHQYTMNVKGNASALGLPVELLNDAKPEVIQATLQKSHVFWHLTGIDIMHEEESDPASLEHFGISVVEAMSAGCIPVVLSKGGTTDIVQNGINGFWANTEQDFAAYTIHILYEWTELRGKYVKDSTSLLRGAPAESMKNRLQSFSTSSVLQSRTFHFDNFRKTLRLTIQRGVLSSDFRRRLQTLNQRVYHKSIAVAKDARYIALIVATAIDGLFRPVVLNVLSHLNLNEWGLMVVHTTDTDNFVKMNLYNVNNVQYIKLPDEFSATSVADYNRLMFSPEFWSVIKAEKVLLFQTDTIILHNGVEKFLEYDYVGAPWDFRDNERVKQLVTNKKLIHGVGNGGFSLRNVSAILHVCKNFSPKPTSDLMTLEQEDLFFAAKFEELGYKIAPRNVAYEFAVEVPIHDMEAVVGQHNPFALHAAWYYWPKADIERWFDQIKL